MPEIQVFNLSQYRNSEDPAPVSSFNLQFLAQGDSWFSIGAMPPTLTTNLLDGMTTTVAACAINCAKPGWKLSRMIDRVRDPSFNWLLTRDRQWSGLLFSGGGNDLIEAIQAAPTETSDMRLLATQAEWTNAPGGLRYLSNPGWMTFSDHLTAIVQELLSTRDSGSCKGIPVVMHTYDLAVPRNVGAGMGFGPWLYRAMLTYGIPQKDWSAVASALLGRLQTLLNHIAATTPDGSLHIVSSQGTLVPAATSAVGPTQDWQNEIHPTPHGYRKLSALWQPVLDLVFG